MQTLISQARSAFKEHGGTLRTHEAIAAGIHPRTLYAMREAGQIQALVRGVYRLASLPPPANPDLSTVAKRIPAGVVCLTSALAYHELTTQIPHEVHLAISRTARHPRLSYPPLHIYRFSRAAFQAGIDTHTIDGIAVRVYGPEKTLADCFKYRNKVGMEIVLEALHSYRRRKHNFQRVLDYARICRVDRLMRPYLEALA